MSDKDGLATFVAWSKEYGLKLERKERELKMKNRIKLAGWAAGLLTLVGLTYFAYELSYFEILLEVDKSYLSWVNLALFAVFYSRLGLLLAKGSTTERDLDPGIEAAEYAMAIGMLGTVVGFIMMTSSMVGADFSNPETATRLFDTATSGMSTALFTTAIGLVVSTGLRFSYYLVGR